VELEFLCYLIGECAKAIEAGEGEQAAALLQEQLDFMRGHLMNWAPRFFGDVAFRARTDFYRGLARFASAYLEQDYAALKEELA